METGLPTRATSKRSKRQPKPSNKAAVAHAEKEVKERQKKIREMERGRKKRNQKSHAGKMSKQKSNASPPSSSHDVSVPTEKKSSPAPTKKQAESPKANPSTSILAAVDASHH